jgi:hypothetical protein
MFEKERSEFKDDLPNSFLCGSTFNCDSHIIAYMASGMSVRQALQHAGRLDFKLIYEKDWGDYDDDE